MNLLVFSSASSISTNRAYIRDLVNNHSTKVHLCILYREIHGNEKNNINLKSEPFSITLHRLEGMHPRLESVQGIRNIIKKFRPNHILLEFDPASKLVNDVIYYGKKINSNMNISCIVLENRRKTYLKDAFTALFKGKLKLFIGNLLCEYFNRNAIKHVSYLFPISRESCDVYSNLNFNTNRIQQVPLGIDEKLFVSRSNNFKSKIRKKLKLNSFTIAYFGRLVPEKGIKYLIQSLSILKFDDWQLLIDSFDTYKSNFSKEIKELIFSNGLEKKIVFFDANHEKMPDYYSAVDLLVLPSIETPYFKEQYGRVLVEAMLTKTMVIGSNTGAIPEILSSKYLIFKSGCSNSLAEKINDIKMLNKKSKKEIINQNYLRAFNFLTSKNQAKEIFNILKNN